jgi:hypothetical protein
MQFAIIYCKVDDKKTLFEITSVLSINLNFQFLLQAFEFTTFYLSQSIISTLDEKVIPKILVSFLMRHSSKMY